MNRFPIRILKLPSRTCSATTRSCTLSSSFRHNYYSRSPLLLCRQATTTPSARIRIRQSSLSSNPTSTAKRTITSSSPILFSGSRQRPTNWRRHTTSRRRGKKMAAAKWMESSNTKPSSLPLSSSVSSSSVSPSFINRIKLLLQKPLTQRIGLFLLASYLITHEDSPQILPLHLNTMDGPSMIPTIWPGGWEMYLRDSLRHRLVDGNDEDTTNYQSWIQQIATNTIATYISRELCVGDVIVFVDYGGKHCCKRIIGVGGDIVCRYGEFSSTLFRREEGRGVPVLPSSSLLSSSSSSSSSLATTKGDTGGGYGDDGIVSQSYSTKHTTTNTNNNNNNDTTAMVVTVPKGYIWVEGDNPLYSIDSRHYGPIPRSNVTGRIIYRVWPRRRMRGVGVQPSSPPPPPTLDDDDEDGNDNSGNDGGPASHRINSCFITSIRPQPIVLRQGEVYGG